MSLFATVVGLSLGCGSPPDVSGNCGEYALSKWFYVKRVRRPDEWAAASRTLRRQDTVSYKDTLDAARSLGLSAQVARLSMDELMALAEPVIVHLKPRHFVLALPNRRLMTLCDEPPVGTRIVSQEQMARYWDGTALVLWEPSENSPLSRLNGNLALPAGNTALSVNDSKAPFVRLETEPVAGDGYLGRFLLRNDGDTTVTIDRIASGCGCLQAPPTPAAIPPHCGREGRILLKKTGSRVATSYQVLLEGSPLVQAVLQFRIDPHKRLAPTHDRQDEKPFVGWGETVRLSEIRSGVAPLPEKTGAAKR